MAPRAPCPRCLRDFGDDSAKGLYAVRGFDDGQYDAVIPAHWLRCPAMKLDASDPGMEAMRVSFHATKIHAIFELNLIPVPVHCTRPLLSTGEETLEEWLAQTISDRVRVLQRT